MRGLSKKILISLLTTLVVFITVFATTYAWVGIFTYANTNSFKMNLKTVEDSDVFLTISNSGKKNTFTDEINSIDIKKQILSNHYHKSYDSENDSMINNLFSRVSLLAPSHPIIENKQILEFERIDLNNDNLTFLSSNYYYKFDIFLSVDTKDGISATTTGINTNVLINDIENTLFGTINSYIFVNKNPFNELPSNPVNDLLKTIPTNFNVDSKNAARFALSLYNPISIDDEYTENDYPIETKIFQGGSKIPRYENENNSYDLGGILPEEQNSALIDLLYIRPRYKVYTDVLYAQKLEEAIEYGNSELELIRDNEIIWNKTEHLDNYLGCMDGIQTKMKITIYFWFEGWDADCLRGIDEQLVTMNLSFTSGIDY